MILVGFDGWLLNIENPIEKDHIGNLVYLAQKLTQSMHEAVPNSEVIWYDSVTIYGELKWQNQLNEVGSSISFQIFTLPRYKSKIQNFGNSQLRLLPLTIEI